MSFHIVGSCGNCGGHVVVPHVWHGIYPPTPTCVQCGSTPKASRNSIPMNPAPRKPFNMKRFVQQWERNVESDDH